MRLAFITPVLTPLWRRVWRSSLCLLALTQAALVQAEPASAAQLKLRVVGGLAGVNQYTRNEEPFWHQRLSQLSGGKYSADIVPFDQAGVPGGDMLRLLELGVVPFGTVLQSALLPKHPLFAANDLAGLSPDMAHLKKNVAAFRPYLEAELRSQHQVKVLAMYVYPAQVLFCKQAFARLADLKGRRIRVSSTSQSDFFSALGAQPVITGFAQIMAKMRTNNLDCAVTGTMSGNTLGLHEVTSHIHTLPISWGMALFAANQSAWDKLPADLQDLLRRELVQLEADIWAESERETADGLACNTGASSCRSGRPGRMTRVSLSAQDDRLRQAIFSQTVLPQWLARCGPGCAGVWQQTIGAVAGP